MTFDLWDVEVNRHLGQYDDEAEVFVLLRTLVKYYGPAYADDLELGGITAEGEVMQSLSGAALIARAERGFRRRGNEQGQRIVAIGLSIPQRDVAHAQTVAVAVTGTRRAGEAQSRKRPKS